MFEKISHINGRVDEDEILFSTPFDYMFPEAARSRSCLLPESPETVSALKALGRAIGTPGDELPGGADSTIPAIFTYLGQFIDHDVTARTDRDTTSSMIGRGEQVTPRSPDEVVATLRNGRRPQLDLDSVFGDAPAFSGTSQSQVLYETDFQMKAYHSGPRRDLVRGSDRGAVIPDARNDENINISQLQLAMVNFYNQVWAAQSGTDDALKFIRARTLVRWAYQHAVVNDYLKTVCDPLVVEDTLANGPRYYGATAGHGEAFMPLEFSTSAFRFGHSMVRPSYNLNATTQNVPLLNILAPSGLNQDIYFDSAAADPHQIQASVVLDFEFYARNGTNVQFARKIDSQIAHGLDTLPFGDRRTDPVLSNLAKSNLLRAYSLSIPTGQAVCDAMGLTPLSATDLTTGETPEIAEVLHDTYLDQRTPLWYYVLREAAVQQGGERLGELGSRIVCETIIGMLKGDPNSYLNNRHDEAVNDNNIQVKPGSSGRIGDLVDILNFAQVANI